MKFKRAFVVVAVLALAALSGPAIASGNAYTVAVGGSTANTSYSLSMTSSGPLLWTFQRSAPYPTNINLNCTSANLSGTGSFVNGGSSGGTSPTAVASLPGMNFGGCLGPGGAYTLTTVSPMVLHGTSSATTAATDVVHVHIEDVSINWQSAVCHLSINGSLNGSFNEATQQLTLFESGFSGDLTYTLVAGCLGQFPGWGNVKLTGTFNVSTAGGAINLR